MTCSWPRGCHQPAAFGQETCYYHGKLLSGLIDGRDLIQPGPKGVLAQADHVRTLSLAGAPQLVVAQAAQPRKDIRTSKTGGGGVPHGRLTSVGMPV